MQLLRVVDREGLEAAIRPEHKGGEEGTEGGFPARERERKRREGKTARPFVTVIGREEAAQIEPHGNPLEK